MADELPEFAVEYSLRERIWLVGCYLTVAGTFALLWKLWLLPALSSFVATAACRSVFGFPGTTALLYGSFVGLPLLAALLVASTLGFRGWRILRDGQSPAIGAKVFRSTRIKRGAAARRIGYLHLLAFTPLLVIAIWGTFTANSLSEKWQVKHHVCAPDRQGTSSSPLRPTPSGINHSQPQSYTRFHREGV